MSWTSAPNICQLQKGGSSEGQQYTHLCLCAAVSPRTVQATCMLWEKVTRAPPSLKLFAYWPSPRPYLRQSPWIALWVCYVFSWDCHSQEQTITHIKILTLCESYTLTIKVFSSISWALQGLGNQSITSFTAVFLVTSPSLSSNLLTCTKVIGTCHNTYIHTGEYSQSEWMLICP